MDDNYKNTILMAIIFLREKFIANPKYSFNNSDIMINHSINVMNYALQIAESENANADKLVIALGALFHDIGKTYDTDEETLRTRHAEFNEQVSKEFLDKQNLTQEQMNKLLEVLHEKEGILEQAIVKDGDMIAFISDEVLQEALVDWCKAKGFNEVEEMQRKLDRFNILKFQSSKKICQPFYEQMKERWKLK